MFKGDCQHDPRLNGGVLFAYKPTYPLFDVGHLWINWQCPYNVHAVSAGGRLYYRTMLWKKSFFIISTNIFVSWFLFLGYNSIEPVATENQPHMHIFVKVRKKSQGGPPVMYAFSKSKSMKSSRLTKWLMITSREAHRLERLVWGLIGGFKQLPRVGRWL